MNEDQVVQFANAAKFVVNKENEISRCVDGRYENIEQFPSIAKPGADAGDVLIAFGAINALGHAINPTLVMQTIVDALGGPAQFNFHSDYYAQESGAIAGMGCGHIKLSQKNPKAYGVTQEQVDYLFTQLPQLIDRGAHQEVLHGDHAEQAVLVVHSHYYGLKPLVRSADGSMQQAFIYQQTLHSQQLDIISKKLHELFASQGVILEEPAIREALNTAFGMQLQQTLSALADGLPLYSIEIDADGIVEIK